MDLVALTHAVTTTLAPALPYLLKAGGKAGEEAAKKIGGDTWEWAKDLWSRLRPKVEANPAALQAAHEVALTPDDADVQAILRVQLKKLLSQDQALAGEAERWFEKAKAAGATAIASGERSVAIGGDVSGSNIITGVEDATVVGSKVDGDVVARDKITQIYQATSPTETALHQLRAPVGDFVGREQEIQTLINALRSGRRASISGISGMGGIGKTELALFVAERLTDEYPDAQFFVNLQGTDANPRRPEEVLATFIRAFVGLEAALPDDLNQLTQLYLSQLSGKRVLVLLDNASDKAQVRPLLPPSGSAVLVTSRHALAVPGMTPLMLNPLTPPEARQLLLEIAPRADPVADQVCYLCGYLPLAIRAAGSLLALTIDLDPADYAEQLKDERTRLERLGTEGVEIGFEASFNLSYARLGSEAARVFRQLAVFLATFDVGAEEVVCADTGHVHLSDLVRRSMVIYDSGTKRYRLHDLGRLFADARLSEKERTEAERLHATHYCTVLSAADELYLEGGELLTSGLALFDLEWANIQVGHAWAEAEASTDQDAATLCIAYPDVGAYVLSLRQHPRDRVRWLEGAVGAARRLKRRASEGNALGNLGIACTNLGETSRAIEFHEQALIISLEIGDRSGECADLGSLGNAYTILGETNRAIEFYECSLAIAREIGNRRSEANALGSLGIAHKDLGEINRAIEFYKQCLAIDRDVGDRRGEGNSLGNLGVAYRKLGETRQAIELYEQQLAITREIGDRRGEANALWNASLALYVLGERSNAIAYAKEALNIREQIEDPNAAKVRAKLAEWQVTSE
ncbi:MAG TPA: tetratricopeptide repeat protein [Pyrinomonadaceae bacterium]|nr:tetratricopeptide repeat protein [Pyrinomonadaceae bacterium]